MSDAGTVFWLAGDVSEDVALRRAVLAALVALYVVVGSMHEEHRLLDAYGTAYERYRRSVPFMLPRPSRRWKP